MSIKLSIAVNIVLTHRYTADSDHVSSMARAKHGTIPAVGLHVCAHVIYRMHNYKLCTETSYVIGLLVMKSQCARETS